MDNDDLVEEITEAVEESNKRRLPSVKTEWMVTAATALSMAVGGGLTLTSAEARVNERLLTIETTRAEELKADARRITAYDKRIEELEGETEALEHELSIRREYQRHVHAHICSLLAKAHGPKTAATEKICSLPEPEFKK